MLRKLLFDHCLKIVCTALADNRFVGNLQCGTNVNQQEPNLLLNTDLFDTISKLFDNSSIIERKLHQHTFSSEYKESSLKYERAKVAHRLKNHHGENTSTLKKMKNTSEKYMNWPSSSQKLVLRTENTLNYVQIPFIGDLLDGNSCLENIRCQNAEIFSNPQAVSANRPRFAFISEVSICKKTLLENQKCHHNSQLIISRVNYLGSQGFCNNVAPVSSEDSVNKKGTMGNSPHRPPLGVGQTHHSLADGMYSNPEDIWSFIDSVKQNTLAKLGEGEKQSSFCQNSYENPGKGTQIDLPFKYETDYLTEESADSSIQESWENTASEYSTSEYSSNSTNSTCRSKGQTLENQLQRGVLEFQDYNMTHCKTKAESPMETYGNVLDCPSDLTKSVFQFPRTRRTINHEHDTDRSCEQRKRHSTVKQRFTCSQSASHQEVRSEKMDKTELFPCSSCADSLRTGENLRRHMMVHEGTCEWQCQECNGKFRSKRSLAAHKRRAHNLFSPITSDGILKRKFIGASSKNNAGPHDKKRFKCKLCSKILSARNSVERHMKIHHCGSREYLCRFCEKRFSTKHNRDLHMYKEYQKLTRHGVPLNSYETNGR